MKALANLSCIYVLLYHPSEGIKIWQVCKLNRNLLHILFFLSNSSLVCFQFIAFVDRITRFCLEARNDGMEKK